MLLQPSKIWLAGLSIAGYDMTNHVEKLSVFETICKPYLTGTLIIRDDSNLVDTLGLVGGEPITFTVSGGTGLDYSQTLYILSMQGQPASNNLRSVKYTIQLIGREYFGDKANMVQKSWANVMGSDIIQSIHGMFLNSGISIPVPSTGMLGQKNNWVTNSEKPFKAINDVRKILTFGGMSGANLYFRDKDKCILTPVEHLFSSASGGPLFEQKNTWGADWRNVFGSYNAIIAASTTVGDGQGRGGVKAMSSMSQGVRKVTDIFSGKKTFDDAILGGGFGGVIAAITGGVGGEHNFPIFDSTKIPKQNVRDTAKDKAYVASVVSRPQVTIKVPFQTGVSCTAGSGCRIKLIPPMGDCSDPTMIDKISGAMLVADVCHEFSPGDPSFQGTTTLRCIKKN